MPVREHYQIGEIMYANVPAGRHEEEAHQEEMWHNEEQLITPQWTNGARFDTANQHMKVASSNA